MNSILARPDGTLYATGFSNDLNVARTHSGISKDGKKVALAEGPKFPIGLAYRPDQWLLVVGDEITKWIYSYQIADDGTLINKERFLASFPTDESDAAPKALCYARENRLLAATNYGVQVCADDGPSQVILPLPSREPVIGLCFGGAELNTLYAFTGKAIWKRVVKLHGIGAFTPWTAVKGNPL